MPYDIGKILKKYRTASNISVKQISDILTEKGFKASDKTIYSWETGNSSPTPDALLVMCEIYGINDVLSAFGYNNKKTSEKTVLTYFENNMIEKYRCLDNYGKELVNIIIDKEFERVEGQDAITLSLVSRGGNHDVVLNRDDAIKALEKDDKNRKPLPPGIV